MNMGGGGKGRRRSLYTWWVPHMKKGTEPTMRGANPRPPMIKNKISGEGCRNEVL